VLVISSLTQFSRSCPYFYFTQFSRSSFSLSLAHTHTHSSRPPPLIQFSRFPLALSSRAPLYLFQFLRFSLSSYALLSRARSSLSLSARATLYLYLSRSSRAPPSLAFTSCAALHPLSQVSRSCLSLPLNFHAPLCLSSRAPLYYVCHSVLALPSLYALSITLSALSFCFRSRSRAPLSPPLSCRAPLSLSPTRCSRSSLSLTRFSRPLPACLSQFPRSSDLSHSHTIHICDCICVLPHARVVHGMHERMCVVCYCLCVQVHCVVWCGCV